MGLSAILLARWRDTRYLYFYYSSFMRCGEVGERAAFFLSKLHLIESWDDQLWYGMLYLFSNRLILLVLFLLLFFFPHIVHFTLLSQFLSTCIRYFCCYQLGTIRDYVNRIAIIWTWSRRLSISQAEAKRVYPGQMVDEDSEKGWVLLSFFFFFFWNGRPSPFVKTKVIFIIWTFVRNFVLGAGPEYEKSIVRFKVPCAVHCMLILQFLYLDLYYFFYNKKN